MRLLLACALACAPLPLATAPAEAADAVVVIGDTLAPRSLTVAPGTRVVWRNDDGARHRPRSVSGPAEFDVDLDPGETGSVTLSAAGTYSYADDRDRDDAAYHGTITVSASPPPASGGGGPAPGSPAAPSAPAAASVTIGDRVFSPGSVTVREGGTVTWTNADDRAHTATGGGFDSGVLSAGGRYARAFATAGTYRYLCSIHPDMTGTVAVVRAGQTAPPPRVVGPGAPAPAPAAPAPAAAAPGGSGAASRTVRVVDFAFAPSSLSARVGDRITFVNAGRAPHTVDSADGTLRSGMLTAGRSYAVTLRRTGTLRYVCAFHPQMTGVVAVSAAGAAALPAPAAAPAGSGPDAAAPSPPAATAAEPAPPAAAPEERRVVAASSGRGMALAGLGLGWVVLGFLAAVWLRTRGEPPYVDPS